MKSEFMTTNSPFRSENLNATLSFVPPLPLKQGRKYKRANTSNLSTTSRFVPPFITSDFNQSPPAEHSCMLNAPAHQEDIDKK